MSLTQISLEWEKGLPNPTWQHCGMAASVSTVEETGLMQQKQTLINPKGESSLQ
ncbi:hypothetical protein JZ751_017406 [Albula glossodonta]|uniref:Uncharacterized protein n=1 Tax=Albula glossodonta TaxID=121402 RepID=A0A8T2PKS8_9TELE|nr:hypothetical protein JZ751_017406 [Albula glossodonta]